MGLKSGDKIKLKTCKNIFTINDEYNLISDEDRTYIPHVLIDEEFEIVTHMKKVGEMVCTDISCEDCPLYRITCMYKNDVTLYEALDNWYEKFHDKEIYDILKSRLDKEVNDE